MSFVQRLKENAKAELEKKIDALTQPLFFNDDCNPDWDPDDAAHEEKTKELRIQKRKLDQLYDRAPVYMATTLKKDYCESLLESTPSDIEDFIILPHDSNKIEFLPDYKGIYSDQKDSFVFRGKKQCLYFRLKDDTKRRIIKRYVKENLNEVAQIVQEETEKIFQEGKESFDTSVSKISDKKGSDSNSTKINPDLISDIKSKYHQTSLDDCV